MNVGLLHPGQMGVTVGAAAAARASVRWTPEGRSAATRRRASEAGLVAVPTLAELVRGSDLLLSVCPPGAALELATQVAQLGFRGLFVDANAVAPATAREIASRLAAVGVEVVDGGIVGPPAKRPGTTRLFLSGPGLEPVVELFAGSPLEAVPIGDAIGAASALKMCYAAWTKGTAALLLAILGLAQSEGVSEPLVAEWSRSQPGLADRARAAGPATAPKAWRFAAEMHEIASTFAAAGLPDGFHRAAEAIYSRLSAFKDAERPDLDAVLAELDATAPRDRS